MYTFEFKGSEYKVEIRFKEFELLEKKFKLASMVSVVERLTKMAFADLPILIKVSLNRHHVDLPLKLIYEMLEQDGFIGNTVADIVKEFLTQFNAAMGVNQKEEKEEGEDTENP